MEIGQIFWSPDCKENLMFGINGKFQAPTIEAVVGDTIVVELRNSLPTEGVVIHWHGIRQVHLCIYFKIWSDIINTNIYTNAHALHSELLTAVWDSMVRWNSLYHSMPNQSRRGFYLWVYSWQGKQHQSGTISFALSFNF